MPLLIVILVKVYEQVSDDKWACDYKADQEYWELKHLNHWNSLWHLIQMREHFQEDESLGQGEYDKTSDWVGSSGFLHAFAENSHTELASVKIYSHCNK